MSVRVTCPSCGEQIPVHDEQLANFICCGNCQKNRRSRSVTPVTTPNDHAVLPLEPTVRDSTPGLLDDLPERRFSLLPFAMVGVLLLVVLAAIGGLALLGDPPPPTNSTTPPTVTPPDPSAQKEQPKDGDKPAAPLVVAEQANSENELEKLPVKELFFAAAFDGPNNIVFLATLNQETPVLRLLDYPSFETKLTVPLEVTPYQLVLDQKKGLLYAAACKEILDASEGPHKQPLASGDIYVFDVNPLLAGKKPEGAALTPKTVIAMNRKFAELRLSSNGKWLYYLDATGTKSAYAGCIDTQTQEVQREIKLLKNTESLCLSPNGKTLYAAATVSGHAAGLGPGEGVLQLVDTATWNRDRDIRLENVDPYDIAVRSDGNVYISEGMGSDCNLYLFDVTAEKVVGEWPGLTRGTMLALAPDGKRLYLAMWTNGVRSLLPPTAATKELRLTGKLPLPDAYQRQMFFSPDGEYLLVAPHFVLKIHRNP